MERDILHLSIGYVLPPALMALSYFIITSLQYFTIIKVCNDVI